MTFTHIRKCRGCGYWTWWREAFKVWFPRKWEGECPHCGGDWKLYQV